MHIHDKLWLRSCGERYRPSKPSLMLDWCSGRMSACQAEGRESESRHALQDAIHCQ